MAKINDTGLYQLPNGNWYYRIKMASDANGNPVDTTGRVDENGQPFKTKSACKRARDKRLVEFQTVGEEKREKYPATLQDMWNVFLEKEADKRAKSTVAKHKSMWKNYIKDRYGNNAFEIGPVKTLKGLREIEMPTVLQRHLIDKYREQERLKIERGYRNTEHVINNDKDRTVLIGADFINRKENGELLTINSVKYYAKKIKEETDVKDFKFHSLRKTHLTQMAALNTPLYELMYRAGHSKVDTIMSYYMGDNEIAKKKLVQNLNSLGTDEPMIELDTLNEDGSKQIIKESDYVKLQRMTKEIPHICEKTTLYSTYHPKVS